MGAGDSASLRSPVASLRRLASRAAKLGRGVFLWCSTPPRLLEERAESRRTDMPGLWANMQG
jgi:hypothetical protein